MDDTASSISARSWRYFPRSHAAISRTFSVDAADSKREHDSFTGTHVQAAYSHGKLMLAFSGPLVAAEPAGVVFWREP